MELKFWSGTLQERIVISPIAFRPNSEFSQKTTFFWPRSPNPWDQRTHSMNQYPGCGKF
jgi:hypothetical protein